MPQHNTPGMRSAGGRVCSSNVVCAYACICFSSVVPHKRGKVRTCRYVRVCVCVRACVCVEKVRALLWTSHTLITCCLPQCLRPDLPASLLQPQELIFGADGVTTGASSDMQQATALAVRMVTQYGFTEGGGLMYTEVNDIKDLSPEHRATVDQEVRKLLDESYNRAKALIVKHKPELHRVAQALLEHETLTGEQLKELLD